MGASNIVPALLAHEVPLDSVRPFPGNPRRGTVEAIARSLRRLGQHRAIVVDRERRIVVGNHTWMAARSLGWDTIAAIEVDDDEAMARARLLADNRTGDLGTYDDQELAEMLRGVIDNAELLAATAYTADEIARLIPPAQAPTFTDPDAVPAPPEKPRTQPGDLWLLGPHRLLCGDSTVPADVERLMAGRRADLVWTDPPYGVAYVGKTADALTIENDAVDEAALARLLGAAFALGVRHTRPGACWFVAAPAGPLFGVFAKILGDLDVWRHTVVWVKDRFVLGHSDYHYRHEALFYGWTPGGAHHPPPDRTQDTVWEIPRPARSQTHPTMKPVALVVRAIENHSDMGDLVLDLFGGSGTTLIAAEATRRRAALVELTARYCDVICRRFQDHTGVLPVLEATGEAVDFHEAAGSDRARALPEPAATA